MADQTWAVVFGGPSPEHEISILTGLQAERVLTRAGRTVLPLYWALNGAWYQVPSGAEAKDFLQGAPAGSKPVEVRLGADPAFPGPYIVKPRFGGSSIGIEIVDDMAAARALARTSTHLRAGAVVEPYRTDLIDLNMSFRTAPELATSPLERPLREEGTGVYSYQQKYLAGGSGETAGLTSAPRELPALVPDDVTERAVAMVRRVAEVTGLTGVVRVDLLYSEATGELVVNEVNSVPGALALYLWADQVPAATVLTDALDEAVRLGVPASGAGFGSGAALRAAGGIAGKLVGLDGPRG